METIFGRRRPDSIAVEWSPIRSSSFSWLAPLPSGSFTFARVPIQDFFSPHHALEWRPLDTPSTCCGHHNDAFLLRFTSCALKMRHCFQW